MVNALSLTADTAEDVANFMGDAADADDKEEEESSSQSEESVEGKKKKPKKGKKSKAKTRGKPSSGPAKKKRSKDKKTDHRGLRRCKTCLVRKEVETEFNESQAKCKGCYNDVRSLQRIATQQKMKTDLEEMERDDPKQHAALLKAFKKQRANAVKTGEKLKFNISQFKLTYTARSGVRGSRDGEMMWEGEWYEEAKKAKHGYLTRKEAEKMWQAWDSNPKRPRDNKGPRGYARLWVPAADRISYYDDAEKAKELSKVENLGKNPSAAALASRMQLLGGDSGMSQHDISEGEKLLDKAASGMAGVSGMDMENSSKDSAFAGDGILAPDVQSLMDDIVKKRKRTEPWAPETLHPKL